MKGMAERERERESLGKSLSSDAGNTELNWTPGSLELINMQEGMGQIPQVKRGSFKSENK